MNTREQLQFAYRVTRAYRSGRISTNQHTFYMQYTPVALQEYAWRMAIQKDYNPSVREWLRLPGKFWRDLWYRKY